MKLLIGGALVLGCSATPDGDRERVDLQEQALCETNPGWVDIEEYWNPHPTTGIGTQFVLNKAQNVGSGYDGEEGVCSGTLISENLFLSAGHCDLGVGDSVRFNFQANFDDPEQPPISYGPIDTYSVTAIVDELDGDPIDTRVLALSGSPGATWGTSPMRASEPEVGEWIVAMGHPSSHIEMVNGTAVYGLKVVSQGPVIPPSTQFPGMIRYRANVRAGMSGGPLFNGDGEVVGVLSRSGCGPGDPFSGHHASPVSQMLQRWQTLGITQLTSLVLPAAPSKCLTASLPSVQQKTAGTSGFVGATSPVGWGAYGFAGCPYSWVVEVTGVLNKSISPRSQITIPPTSSSACLSLMHTTVIQGFKNNQWHTISQQRAIPEWDNGACSTVQSTSLSSSHGYSKVRIVARVEDGDQHSQLGPALKKVTAGVNVN